MGFPQDDEAQGSLGWGLADSNFQPSLGGPEKLHLIRPVSPWWGRREKRVRIEIINNSEELLESPAELSAT